MTTDCGYWDSVCKGNIFIKCTRKTLLFDHRSTFITLRYNWNNKGATGAGEVTFGTEVEHNTMTYRNGIYF